VLRCRVIFGDILSAVGDFMRQEIVYIKIISERNRLSASSVIHSVWIMYSLFAKSNNTHWMSSYILQEITHHATTHELHKS
jgi:hypothetical protein